MYNQSLDKKVELIINSLLNEKGYVSTVDVLLKLEYLSHKDYEEWRHGHISFFERACKVNLKKLCTISKLIWQYAEQNKLQKSFIEYNQWASKGKRKLKFSKSGNPIIELLYATHYLDTKKIDELKSEWY